MPLLDGDSDEVVSANISELILSGYPRDQAVAIAYKKAGRARGEKKEPMRKSIPILFVKSGPHPVAAGWRAPTEAQAKAGNYKTPRMRWQGLEIAIECPVGTVRSGRDRDGNEWSIRMLYPYGYLVGTQGLDGDPVDCYVGPDADAPFVYVVMTRVPGQWDKDDEQKAMIGFASEEDARSAFLKHYDDPRFLGSIRAVPVAKFVRQVKGAGSRPVLIKAVRYGQGGPAL